MNRRSRLLAAFATGALCVAGAMPATAQVTTGDVERALPPGSVTVREVQGGGAQIYTCQQIADQFAWVLFGPQAVLVNDDGTAFGIHIPGPKWIAQDGSAIAADNDRPLARIAHPNALPSLLLPVTVSTGHGALSGILYVSRTGTEGGLPPDVDCTPARVGTSVARHYSAVYRFFK